MPTHQQRTQSPHVDAPDSVSSTVETAVSNQARIAALLGDGTQSETFTYVCTGAETYGTLAAQAGGDYQTAMTLNPTVRPEGLRRGTELQLPRAWARSVGSQDPFFEVFAHIGQEGEADTQTVRTLWEHLSASERLLILKNPRTSAEAKQALGLGVREAGQDDASVTEQLVAGSVALAVAAAQSLTSTQSAVEDAGSEWWWAKPEVSDRSRSDRQAPEMTGEPVEPELSAEAQLKQERQAQMRAVFDEYTQMRITVVIQGQPTEIQVRAKYKISVAEGGLNPWDLAARYSQQGKGTDWATSKSGKATADNLESSLQQLADGPLQARLNAASNAEEAKALIERTAHHNLGIDCSGFVFRMMQGMGDDAALHVNRNAYLKKAYKATPDPNSIHAWNAADGNQILTDGMGLTGRPAQWTTGDIINKPGVGGKGHIAIIYDVTPDPDGRHQVEFMESNANEGVKETTVWFDDTTQQWQNKGGGIAGWPTVDATVTRPKPFVG